ncbi:MAG: group II intron reverse transcriptase/maturase [Cyclobacteriaceae bacterium]|nr:group II intron reverse transcriptase/maturase [Cyclobacteriaceae bacterium]
MEPQGMPGERSNSKASAVGRDEENKPNELLEQILSRENMNLAYLRVKENGGSAGIDKMQTDELLEHLKQHGKALIEDLFAGRYKPQAVKRVEIPKPEGGKRGLGIPIVVDRMIQQAISQILTPIFDVGFSAHSYGFRPGRNAHQAIKQAREYINEGYQVVVDIDLEKFFDRVNHDKLMHLVSKKVHDKRVLKLIRRYLESGIMEKGVFTESNEGTPQGGPLSPLLSNIMLDELDKELEGRGHRFCRYADDCNIYVRSKRSAERVMSGISRFIEDELRLKVNQSKSEVGSPKQRKFLGFSFYQNKEGVAVRIHEKSLKRIKEKVRKLTSRSRAMSMEERILKLSNLIIGWTSYFRLAHMKRHCQELDEWMRRRLRMCHWKDWKKISTKYNNLIKLGTKRDKAWEFANTRKSYWRTAHSPILHCTLTNAYFERLHLHTFSKAYSKT